MWTKSRSGNGVLYGEFLALTEAIFQIGSQRKSINTSLVIVNSLSQSQSQFALSSVEDRDVNEEHSTGPSYCSHFLPCQLSKLRMIFLFVLHFICCKMLDLAQTNTWCADPPITPKAVNTVVRAVSESEEREVGVKKWKHLNGFILCKICDFW